MPENSSLFQAADLNRREILQIGFSGFLGMGLQNIVGAQRSASAADATHFGKVKSVIFVFLTGAPSHQDMWDLKPEAPAAIRGEFQPIDTNVPGVQISEHLPKLSQLADKYAIIRSMTHSLPSHEHGTHRMLTGINKEPVGSTHMASRRDFPCYASGLQYLHPRPDGLPTGVMLPTYLNNGYGFCGQNAGFLGGDYDPWHVTKDPNAKDFRIEELQLSQGVTVERLGNRQELLQNIDAQRRTLDKATSVRDMSQRMKQAHNLLSGNSKFRDAFDMDGESTETRDRYGRHVFGQSLLLSRRLVEAGIPIIQANMGSMNHWDTHGQNFKRLKETHLPPFDQGMTALVTDLEQRGLLKQTMIVATGEFGRTPQINANAGRDHWSRVFSAVFFGGGIRGGQVIGASDSMASDPATRGWYPADFGATIYSALGIDPESIIIDRLQRPHQLNAGAVIDPLYT